jgi:hypothetical protein
VPTEEEIRALIDGVSHPDMGGAHGGQEVRAARSRCTCPSEV